MRQEVERKRYIIRTKFNSYHVGYYTGRDWLDVNTNAILSNIVEFFDLPVEGTGILINRDSLI